MNETQCQLHITTKMTSLKGPGAAQQHDGSALRIGIVHARWNTCKLPHSPHFTTSFRKYILIPPSFSAIIEALLAGTKSKLLAAGVKESNIVVQSVPGSWELPIACSK